MSLSLLFPLIKRRLAFDLRDDVRARDRDQDSLLRRRAGKSGGTKGAEQVREYCDASFAE